MAKQKQQRALKLNNGQEKQKKRPQCLPLFLMGFIGVLVCFIAVMLKVTWKIHEGARNRGSAGGAAPRMLSNFVETGSEPIKQKHTKSDNKHQRKSSPSSPVDQLIDRSRRIEIPDRNRTLAFVHIGKSGGSTISLLLRNGCMTAVDGASCEKNRWKKIPGQNHETIASERIQFYLHTPHVESGKMAEYYKRVSSVVVVARDPLERFISAFLCRHPSNIDGTRKINLNIRKQAELEGIEPPIWAKPVWGGGDVEEDQVHRAAFKGCYPNVEELVDCATQSKKKAIDNIFKTTIKWVKRGDHFRDLTLNCKEVCQGIVRGENKFVHHVRFNYEAFLKDLPPETEVLAIRTKNLWQDWINVNNMLGSKTRVEVPGKGNDGDMVNARGNLPVTNNLSKAGRSTLCELLKGEIRIYVDLLNRAVNLSDNDVRSALEGVQKNCPAVLKSFV